MQHNEDNLLGILRIIFRRKKFILTTCTIVAVGTTIIALFLPNYFEATTSFYPASNSLLDPNRVYATSESGVEYFGGDEEVNQLLSAAESRTILDEIVKEFNLYEIYDIDTSDVKASHKVRKTLLKRYQVLKNMNDGIDVSVEDIDPKRAALMANTIRHKIDLIHRNFLRENQKVVIQTHEKSLADRTERLKLVTDSLVHLREIYQIYNVEAQSEFLGSYVPKIQADLAGAKAKLAGFKGINQNDSTRYYQVIVNSLQNQLSTLTKNDGSGSVNLQSLKDGMGKVLALEYEHEQISEDISEQKELYMRFKNILNSDVSSLVAVEPAEIPVVKSRPVRSVLILTACIIAFILSVLGALIFENYKEVDWQDIMKG